jgi:hypothetical protein
MLFVIIGTPRSTSEVAQHRALQLFTNGSEPSGYTTKVLSGTADGGFGAVAEAESAAAVTEAGARWVSFFELRLLPAVEAEGVVPLLQRVYTWAESVH